VLCETGDANTTKYTQQRLLSLNSHVVFVGSSLSSHWTRKLTRT